MATASAQVLNQDYSSGSTITKSITISNPGSVIAATGLLAASNSSNAISGVSDPTNGSYTKAKGQSNVILGGNLDNSIYYFENAATGTYTVTLSFTGTQVDHAELILEEITGCKTSGALNQVNGGESSGSTSTDAVTAGNITVTSGDFVLASTIGHNALGCSHGTGYTDSYNAGGQFATEHIANSSSGSKAGSFTANSSSTTFESVVVSFLANTGTAYTLTASGSSYSISGTAASLRIARNLVSGSGTYSISGTATTLRFGHKVPASSGSYSINGSSVGLAVGRKVAAGSTSYSFTGSAATLKVGRKITASSDSYVFSFADVNLMYSAHHYTLTANGASYAFNINDVTLNYHAIEDTSENSDDQHFDNYVRRYANDRDQLSIIEDNLTEPDYLSE